MPQPTPITSQPPPELPNMPDVGPALTNYLRTFSLWCRKGFAAQMKAGTALPGYCYRPTTRRREPTPAVYQLGVSSGGELTLAPVPLAGTPGRARVPVGEGDYLPIGGGEITGPLGVDGGLAVSNSIAVSGGIYYGRFIRQLSVAICAWRRRRALRPGRHDDRNLRIPVGIAVAPAVDAGPGVYRSRR